jgi:hypothetical protein
MPACFPVRVGRNTSFRTPAWPARRNSGSTITDWDLGLYADCVRASKGGAPACSNFSSAGPFNAWAAASHYTLERTSPPVQKAVSPANRRSVEPDPAPMSHVTSHMGGVR